MVKITNIFGDRYSGQAGKAGVFATWKGRQYRRAYVIPSNPNTTKQLEVRDSLKNAITRWHSYITQQRQSYAYMAAGQVMSGFNLFCSRWQKQMPNSAANMIVPSLGIKQVGYTAVAEEDVNCVPSDHIYALSASPVEIGSMAFTLDGADEVMDVVVEIEQGFVRIPAAITKIDGNEGAGAAPAIGDKLLISYTSGGRVVTREVLQTLIGAEVQFDAKATMALAFRTAYSPIDFGSVVIEIQDVSPTPDVFTAINSMETDNINGEVHFDLDQPAVATSKVNYNSYTPASDVKLEMSKADTSFIAWRAYSDANGLIYLAATNEDETFDSVFTKSGHTSVIATAQTAALAALSEFVDMGVPS
jgi:hypothetical protein